MPRCLVCKAPLEPDDWFCPTCGASVVLDHRNVKPNQTAFLLVSIGLFLGVASLAVTLGIVLGYGSAVADALPPWLALFFAGAFALLVLVFTGSGVVATYVGWNRMRHGQAHRAPPWLLTGGCLLLVFGGLLSGLLVLVGSIMLHAGD